MNIQGVINESPPIKAPKNLTGTITAVLTTPITDKEANLISIALHALGKQIEIDALTNLKNVNMVFTSDGIVNLKMLDYPVLANHVDLCIYAVDRWRKQYSGDDGVMLTIILEELCHHFYTDDEKLVKTVVYNVMKNIIPSLEMSQIYT